MLFHHLMTKFGDFEERFGMRQYQLFIHGISSLVIGHISKKDSPVDVNVNAKDSKLN